MGNVDYELVIVEELPPASRSGGGTSVLENQLKGITENEAAHGKWVRMGLYPQGTAATAAKNVLQQRHGRGPAAEGWKFETRRVATSEVNEDGTVPKASTGLFAKYSPDQIVAGAMDAHVESERKRLESLVEKRAEAEREAEKKAVAEEKARQRAAAKLGRDTEAANA